MSILWTHNKRELWLGKPTAVQGGNDSSDVTGVGTPRLSTNVDYGGNVYSAMQDVLILPDVCYNLVLVSSLTGHGAMVTLEQNGNCVIFDSADCFKVMREGRLYKLADCNIGPPGSGKPAWLP